MAAAQKSFLCDKITHRLPVLVTDIIDYALLHAAAELDLGAQVGGRINAGSSSG